MEKGWAYCVPRFANASEDSNDSTVHAACGMVGCSGQMAIFREILLFLFVQLKLGRKDKSCLIEEELVRPTLNHPKVSQFWT